ncbi:DNA-binding protein [candidate division MSBL1 archaeon SCGC-AAA261O19]|uniref:DNA-binding protein n=2 Tax=candidate division MSBL1 TaxID=215777 RepID=A0A133V2E7_9EURY|nr:DNA-binding protein [candidate division MSBL1 archaeon SCGC-AAA261C02]KXB04990.1 DNA-binding protein [candidate division MSBL1 archaeon SCGC-AAA261O19]
MAKKYEDHGIVLDFMPSGRTDERKPAHLREPLAQLLGKSFFTLLEAVPNPKVKLKLHDEVYIGKGDREKIERVKRRIGYKELTAASKAELPVIIEKLIEGDPERFLKFFNEAGPVTSRYHQLELIPGIGKKLMWGIIEAREEKPFEDFEDLNNRVKSLPRPKRIIAKRIEKELKGEDKYRIFVRRPKQPSRGGGSSRRGG